MKNLLGNNIKKLRTEHKLTLEQLAETLNRSYPGTINFNKGKLSKWENNKEEPKLSSIRIIADFFNVTVDDLSSDNFETTLPSISSIYDRLNEERRKRVYNFAEEQLEKQNSKIVALPKKEKDPLEVRAAHIDDDATDEERQEAYDFIDSLEDED